MKSDKNGVAPLVRPKDFLSGFQIGGYW